MCRGRRGSAGDDADRLRLTPGRAIVSAPAMRPTASKGAALKSRTCCRLTPRSRLSCACARRAQRRGQAATVSASAADSWRQHALSAASKRVPSASAPRHCPRSNHADEAVIVAIPTDVATDFHLAAPLHRTARFVPRPGPDHSLLPGPVPHGNQHVPPSGGAQVSVGQRLRAHETHRPVPRNFLV